jgi:hypothetical protein
MKRVVFSIDGKPFFSKIVEDDVAVGSKTLHAEIASKIPECKVMMVVEEVKEK